MYFNIEGLDSKFINLIEMVKFHVVYQKIN